MVWKTALPSDVTTKLDLLFGTPLMRRAEKEVEADKALRRKAAVTRYRRETEALEQQRREKAAEQKEAGKELDKAIRAYRAANNRVADLDYWLVFVISGQFQQVEGIARRALLDLGVAEIEATVHTLRCRALEMRQDAYSPTAERTVQGFDGSYVENYYLPREIREPRRLERCEADTIALKQLMFADVSPAEIQAQCAAALERAGPLVNTGFVG